DRIGTHRAGGGGRGREAEGAAQGAGRVTVDEAAVAGREGRVGLAVGLAGTAGCCDQRRGRDGQRAAGKGDGVVAAGQAAGRNSIDRKRAGEGERGREAERTPGGGGRGAVE